MAQQVRKRQQKTVSFTANNKVTENLSRGNVYRELWLRLEGSLTMTTAENVYADILAGDEWALISRIDLIANNTDVIKSIKGKDLWWLNYFMYGGRPEVSPLLGAGGANPTFDSTLVLPIWMPRSIRPMDTALDARQLSDLKIEITWADATAVAAAAAILASPTLKVSSVESFNVQGPFSQWRFFPIEKEITADNPQFQIQLPVGPMYRGFLMNFTDAAVDDPTALQNFKWKSGTTVFADMESEVLRQEYFARNGLVRPFTGVAYADLRLGNANDLDGWYFYDHVTDGFNSEAVDTLGFSEHELELDVLVGAGTTKAIIYPMQIIPVRGGQAAAAAGS